MRLLFVTYHFPPSRTARSLQIGKLTRRLLERGVELTVVTVDPNRVPADSVDASVGAWVRHDATRLMAIDSPRRTALDLARVALTGQNHPGWTRGARRAAERALRDGNFDALVSFSMPIDSHFVGLDLKRRRPRMPWAAHFSDPWATNPFIGASAARRKLLQFHERRICAAADRVLTVSEAITEHFAERYGDSRRFRTLPHVYEPGDYPDRPPPKSGPIALRYIGGFSSNRPPHALFEAVRQAKAAGADLNALRVELIGIKMAGVAAGLNEIHAGLAVAPGAVAYEESLALMRSAHALLLIDADQRFSPYFPSKLADYLGAERPIVCVTPSHSYTTRLMKRFGGVCFDPLETAAFARLLGEICARGVTALPTPNGELIAELRAERVAEQFERLMREMIND